MTSLGDYSVCDNLTAVNLTATNMNAVDLHAAQNVYCDNVIVENSIGLDNTTISMDSSLLVQKFSTEIQATKLVLTNGSPIATVDYTGKSNILAVDDYITFGASTISVGGGISWGSDIQGEQQILSVGANAFTFNLGKNASAAVTKTALGHNMTFDVYYSLEMMPALSTASDAPVWTRTTQPPTTSYLPAPATS